MGSLWHTEGSAKMHQSQDISEVAKALAAAQLEMKPAKKSGFNPHFKSHFPTLGDVSEACLTALNKNGIAVAQTTGHDGEGHLCLWTSLLHSSGQWIASIYPVVSQQNTPQGIGSALSYARRYSLAGIAGVVTEDNDAEGAMNHDAPEKKPVTQKVATRLEKGVTATKPSVAQLSELFIVAHKNGWGDDDVRHYIGELGLESTKELSWFQLNDLMEKIKKFPKH